MPNRSKTISLKTGNRIRELRVQKGLTQKELAEKLFKSESAIRMWELGKSEPDIQSVNLLAQIFGVSPSYLTGWERKPRPTILSIAKPARAHSSEGFDNSDDEANTIYINPDNISYEDFLEFVNQNKDKVTVKKGVRIPVYGSVAAGIPIEAITDIEDYEEITEDMARTGSFAALKIKGDSMEPRFTAGDVVIVKLQDDVDSGDIAIVLVNGDEATCKKIKKTPEGVMLISTNPNYEPMFYSNREIEEKPVRIWGKVVELRAKF